MRKAVALQASAFHLAMLRDVNNAGQINELIQKYMQATRIEVVSA
jgi:hypothetical protein